MSNGKRYLKYVTFFIIIMVMMTHLGCRKQDDTEKEVTKTQSKSQVKTVTNKISPDKTTQKSSTAIQTGSNEDDNNTDNNETDTGDNGNSGIVDSPDNEDTNEPSEITEDYIDLGGKTIIVASPNINWYPPDRLEDVANELMQIRWQSWKDVEQKYNCKIVFNGKGTGNPGQALFNQEFVSNFTAGIFYCDAYILNDYNVFPSYVNNKMVLCWEDLYDFRNNTVWSEFKSLNWGEWKGKLYGIKLNPGNPPGTGLWYNKDLLASAGIPDLWQYVDEGRWNWSAFTEVSQSLTKDLDGNGIIDQWGHAAKPNNLAEILIASNGGTIVNFTGETASYNMDDPRNIRALQFTSDLYNTYKVLTTEDKLSTKNSFNEFPLGSIGSFFYGMAYGATCRNAGLTNVGWVYVPMGPDADDYRLRGSGSGMGIFLHPHGTDPEAAAMVLQDYMCVWDPSESYFYDEVKGRRENSLLYVNDDRALEFAVNGYTKNTDLYVLHYNLSNILNPMYNQIIKLEVPVVAGMDAVRQQAIAMVESLENP